MAAAFSPQDVDCPDPNGCMVADTLPVVRIVSSNEGVELYRVYNAKWGYDEHNPGYGDARFTPIDDPATIGSRLPSMYLAATATAALLETVFHDVHHDSSRTIYERDLRGMLLAHVQVPAIGALGDLRDPMLDQMSLRRSAIVSGPAEHYPCTRRLAIAALSQSNEPPMQGLIWHSRQAELAGEAPAEVLVLFGGARYPSDRGKWRLFGPGTQTLYEGPGRLLVDEIAEKLGAVIELEER